jgi:hypothetical protein
MIRDAEYLIWRRSDGREPGDVHTLPWMAFEPDPSHVEIYGERNEAWSLFHAGDLSFVCRKTLAASYAWRWHTDPDEPYADPAMLLANPAHFLAPTLSYARYDPIWAPAVFKSDDSRRQCARLLALLVDAVISGRHMVALTSLEGNDWYAGSDLSLWLAFAVAALPYPARKNLALQTSCPRPRDAITLGAHLVTYDFEKNRTLSGFDPNWLVWRLDQLSAPRQSQPTTVSLEFATLMLDEAWREPRFLPSISRLLTLDDLRSGRIERLVRETARIARNIEPEERLSRQLPMAASQLDGDPAGVRAALLCGREGVATPERLARKLWTVESVDQHRETLQDLPEPVNATCVERLCWAECHTEKPALLNDLRSLLLESCQASPGDLRELYADRPQWKLWRLLPLPYFVGWAAGSEPLTDDRLSIVNRHWSEDPVGTVRQLAGGHGWLRWIAGWCDTASEAEKKRMAMVWFSGCEPDSLLEEWACALALLPSWTIQDIQDLADRLATMDVPPRLEYLEDEQDRRIAEVGANVQPGLTDARYRAAYSRFHIDTRQWDARLLFDAYTRLMSSYAGGPA